MVLDRAALVEPGPVAAPEPVRRQIDEVLAAKQAAGEQGMRAGPAALYHLAILAAHRRD